MRMHKKAVVALAILALAGCGLGRPALVEESPELRGLRGAPGARSWFLRNCEAEVRIGVEYGEKEWPLTVEQGVFSSDLVKALETAKIFGEGSRGDGPPYPLDLAVTVIGAKGRFIGRNGLFLPNMVLWAIGSPLLACLVADEDYRGWIQVQAELREPDSEKPVWSAEVEAELEASLDHFQRGLSFWDLFFPGPLLASASPEKVSDIVVPHILRKLEIELARKLSKEVPAPEVDVLVAVGCGSAVEKAGAPGLRFCGADAKAFAEAFSGRPGKKELLLLCEGATGAGLRKTMENLAARKDVRIRDFILFYSGPGTLKNAGKGKAEAALAFSVGTGDVLRVSEVLSLVKDVPAKSRCVLLDTGFCGKGGRALESKAPGEVLPLPSGKGMPVLMTACGPDESGFESAEVKGGALTRALLPLLVAGSDRNGDGAVMTGEISSKVAWFMSRKLRVAGGAALTPHIAGDGVVWRVPEEKP